MNRFGLLQAKTRTDLQGVSESALSNAPSLAKKRKQQVTMATAPPPPPNLMYLPKDFWSKRYEDSFYTIHVEGYERYAAAPEGSNASARTIGGHGHHPAFYYKVVVYRSNQTKVLWRRFSQFVWLYRQVKAKLPPPLPDAPPAQALRLPPGTCWPFQSEGLAQERVELLSAFLDDLLGRPGYASHPAVVTFLEL